MRGLPLLFLLSVLAAPVSAQTPVCEWTGQPTLTALRVASSSPAHISLLPLSGRRAVVSLVAIGVFDVHTLDDQPELRGTTREPIAIVVSGAPTFAGVATVSSGARVEDLRPRRAGLEGSIVIGDGVRIERLTLPCELLGLSSEVSATPMSGPTAHGPLWLARTRRLRMRDRPELGAPRVTITLVDRARYPFVERERRDGWVRVEALFPQASLSGWVADTELARIP